MKAAALAVALATLGFGANAAGLGKLTVLSGLGQPLRAEIDLSATNVELSSMTVRLAPPETFKETGVDYASTLSAIKFDIGKRRNGKPYLKLSSERPISEPFLDMLIQVDWAQGRLVREYTFLLDPPEALTRRQAVAPVTPPQASNAAPVPKQAPAPAPSSAAAPAPEAAQPTASQAAAGTHTVKRGETLRRIAEDVKPEGVTVDQMLVAIFDANKSAFVSNNMNRLRSGAILTIPDRDTAAAKTQQVARREVVAQAASFNAYRRRVAEATSAAEAPPESAAQQSASGKIVPRIEEKAPPAAASSDQLKVSKSDAPGKTGPGDKADQTRVAALQEDLVAREKALKEANSRLAELEKNVGELQKLLEMKNQAMADLQKQAAAKAAEPAPPAPAAPVSASAPAVTPAAQPAAAATPPVEAKPEEKAAPVAAPPKPEGEAAASVAPPPQAAVEKPAAPKPAPKKPAPPPTVEEPGLLSGLMENPLALYGGGGALLALLALVGFRARQRKTSETLQPTTTLGQGTAPSVFGSTGGQSVDTSASSIQTDFSHSGMAAIDADEGVDPVAEADVYMAYGRDAQAEEILLDALKTEPSRQAIRVKLLEIYAQRKSLKQFDTLAGELYAQTGGAGADWEKATAMGRKLDPANPLYGQTGESAVPASGDVLSAALGGVVFAAGASAAAAAASDVPAQDAEESNTAKMRDTWTMPGALGREELVGSDSEANAVTLIKAAVGADANEPATGLDFDLPELESPAAAAEANITEPAALDFDLGLDLPTAEPLDAERTEPESIAALASEVPVQDVGLEAVSELNDAGDVFSGADSVSGPGVINFDLGPELEPEVSRQPDLLDADMPVMDLERTDVSGTLIDFNLNDLTSTKPIATMEVMDLERTDVGGSMLAFNYEATEGGGPLGAAGVEPTLDLSDISLDLPELDSGSMGGEGDSAVSLGEAGGSADDNAEAATKLDLAKAYEEMGDREGARELLEEVLREGTAAQQDKARNMMAALA